MVDSEPCLHHAWNLSRVGTSTNFRKILSSPSYALQLKGWQNGQACYHNRFLMYLTWKGFLYWWRATTNHSHHHERNWVSIFTSFSRLLWLLIFRDLTTAVKSIQKVIVYFSLAPLLTSRLLLLKRKELEQQKAAYLTVLSDICCMYTFREYPDTDSVP